MKFLAPTLLFAGLVAPLLAYAADRGEPAAGVPEPATPELQLVIEVTSQPDPMEARESAEVFAQLLEEMFRRSGYKGEINPLSREAPKPNLPLLEIRLSRWRIGPLAQPECAFSAVLTRGDEKARLGQFSANDLTWNKGVGNADQGEALRRVALDALRDLARQLSDKGLLPGFPPTRAKR
jgi:hypothetical protein